MFLPRISPLFAFAALVFLPAAASATEATLAGEWRYDASRSTELSAWTACDLRIAIVGDKVSIHRRLSWSRRDYEDQTDFTLAQPAVTVPADWWPDNRHLGAYIGADHTKRVRGESLDQGRILRVTTDLVLETQQGSRAINGLSDYKVSTSGDQLTLTELRSTRNRPIVYIFKRVTAAAHP